MEDVNVALNAVTEIVTAYGLKAIGAIVILIVGLSVAGWARGAVNRILTKSGRVDAMLRGFFASMVRYLIIAITVIAVLGSFGVQTASLIAVLGAAGLAIGLALQGTLSNVAAGVMLLLFRPFRVGDYIEGGGEAGTVKEVTLFTTELATPDNVQIIVPNAQLWGTAIKNYSFHDTRRVDFALGCGYEDDLDRILDLVRQVAAEDPRVLADPAPMAVVSNWGDNAIDITARVWCKSADYWDLKFDLTKTLKQRFDAAGFNIPFPQRVVHLVQEPVPAAGRA